MDASTSAADGPTQVMAKKSIVADFLRSAPPGEFNDVYNDVQILLGDDDELDEHVMEAVAQYNKEQLTVVSVEGIDHPVIISEYNEMEDGRYMDPKTRKTFAYDHLHQSASEVEDPEGGDHEEDSTKDSLEAGVEAYVQDHFSNGASAVYPCAEEYVIAIVDNKYNPNNYWNGRWRSTWQLAKESPTKLHGKIYVQVHYYEDGNVQLETSREVEVDFKTPSDSAQIGKAVAKAIDKSEAEFQASLNDACAQLSDTTFKALRRALPVTRNKIEWTKLGGYQVGAEAAKK